jgi:hypothetical protein
MMLSAAALAASLALGSATAMAHDNDPAHAPSTSVTVTNVAGTITQLNLSSDGTINGMLLGTNVLLSFPSSVCGGVGTLGHVGDAVVYSGYATTNTVTGFQRVSVSSFTNGSISYTSASPEPVPAAYGPVSGTVGALNHASNGNVNGFIFGSMLVITGTPSAALAPLMVPGAAITVTGTSETEKSCATVPPVTVVTAASLTIGTTVFPIAAHHSN